MNVKVQRIAPEAQMGRGPALSSGNGAGKEGKVDH